MCSFDPSPETSRKIQNGLRHHCAIRQIRVLVDKINSFNFVYFDSIVNSFNFVYFDSIVNGSKNRSETQNLNRKMTNNDKFETPAAFRTFSRLNIYHAV